MMDEFDRLEAEFTEADKKASNSVAALSNAVRGGVGSPIEERIAKAMVDQAAVSTATEKMLATVVNGQEKTRMLLTRQEDLIREQNRQLEAVSRALKDAEEILGANAYRATEKALNSQRIALDRMEEQADLTIGALGKLDQDAASNYTDAVQKSCSRLLTATAASAALIAALSIIGGILAAIGAFWLFSVNPFIQQFLKDVGGVSAFIIVVGILIAAWLIYCIVTRKR